MKTIRVLTLEVDHARNVLEKKLRWINPAVTRESLRQILDCRAVDTVSLEINGQPFTLWFDDEFRKREKPVPTFILDDDNLTPLVLMGNLLFSRGSQEDSIVGLEQDDILLLDRLLEENFIALRYYLQEVGFLLK